MMAVMVLGGACCSAVSSVGLVGSVFKSLFDSYPFEIEGDRIMGVFCNVGCLCIDKACQDSFVEA